MDVERQVHTRMPCATIRQGSVYDKAYFKFSCTRQFLAADVHRAKKREEIRPESPPVRLRFSSQLLELDEDEF